MAAQKPVIIAGNEGYIGLFDQSKLQVGIDTNFCCRGCEESSPELLKNDILRFWDMPDEEKKALGIYGQELIKKDYSVSRMTDDCIKVYEWAMAKHDEILISGYYGFKNRDPKAVPREVDKPNKYTGYNKAYEKGRAAYKRRRNTYAGRHEYKISLVLP